MGHYFTSSKHFKSILIVDVFTNCPQMDMMNDGIVAKSLVTRKIFKGVRRISV